MTISFTASQIAKQLEGRILGNGSIEITGFASADHARAGDLTFAEKESYFATAEQSQASAILVSDDFTSASKVLIKVPDARVAVAKILPLFFVEGPRNCRFLNGFGRPRRTCRIVRSAYPRLSRNTRSRTVIWTLLCASW